MEISKKTYLSFGIFMIFGIIFMILLAQTTALNLRSVFQELDEKELEWGKSILEQCKLPYERYAEMKETLFNAEQELLNDNLNNAAKYFNLIRPALGTCAFELSGKPHPLETGFGQAMGILTAITGGINLGLFIHDLKRKVSTKKE